MHQQRVWRQQRTQTTGLSKVDARDKKLPVSLDIYSIDQASPLREPLRPLPAGNSVAEPRQDSVRPKDRSCARVRVPTHALPLVCCTAVYRP